MLLTKGINRKNFKTVGHAVMAATALMAFAAGPASATVIEDGNGQLLKGTTIDASHVGPEKLKFEIGSTVLVECLESTIEAVTTNNGSASETVKGAVAAAGWTFGECTRRVSTLAGANVEFHWASGSNGTLAVSGLEVTINTIFGSCVYGFGVVPASLGEVKGGTPATLAVSTAIKKLSGPCPSEGALTANYVFTKPTTLRVTQL